MSEQEFWMHVHGSLRQMTATVVCSYLTRNAVAIADIPGLIRLVADSLRTCGFSPPPLSPPPAREPAVPIRKSVFPDFIICLEDGRRLKMLKRYLRQRYGITPEQYRVRWGLPADYPMVAPEYTKRRSDFAKKIGLGKPGRAATLS